MYIIMAKFLVIILFTIICFFCVQVECRNARMIGGSPTNPGEFKHVVFINRKDVHGICTGGIVSKDLILTAAHCVLNRTTNVFIKGRIQVIAGKNQILQSDVEAGILVKTIIVPEFYDARIPSSKGDFGLMTLAESLDNGIEQLSLPITGFEQYGLDPLKFAGFGWTDVVLYKNGTYDHENPLDGLLRKTDMGVTACNGYSYRPPEGTFCAKMMNYEHRDSIGICQGDSGGPLVDSNNVVVGIASYGHKGCNENVRPTVFTQVSSYRSAIIKAMKGETFWRFKHANKNGHF